MDLWGWGQPPNGRYMLSLSILRQKRCFTWRPLTPNPWAGAFLWTHTHPCSLSQKPTHHAPPPTPKIPQIRWQTSQKKSARFLLYWSGGVALTIDLPRHFGDGCSAWAAANPSQRGEPPVSPALPESKNHVRNLLKKKADYAKGGICVIFPENCVLSRVGQN